MDMISRALQQLHDDELRLSQAQISAGSTSHQYIANVLKNRRYRDPNFPWIIETILSGSYIRRTKPYPLNDIDMLVILDGHGLYEYKWGRITAAEVRGQDCGSPVQNICNEYGLICSKRLLDRFRNAIAETYPFSKVRKDGQAINVQLSSGIGLDLVPCIEVFPADGSREYLYIPGGTKSEWIITNPRIDREISDALHAFHNRLLRPAVRLAKLWNEEQNACRLKAYHVEVLVWRAFGAQMPVMNLRDGLTRFFMTAPNAVLSPCDDPTGLGGQIDGYLSPAARWESHQRLEAAKSELLHSLLPGAWNFVAWNRIFSRPLELIAA
ncbi:MAG: hypothetical protein ACFCUR_07395 [Rhodomicrobiaceae bacterium]